RVEPRDDHVVAWRHAEDPEIPAVVRGTAALRNQSPGALEIPPALEGDGHVRDRVAGFVDDSARDHGARREGEVNVLEHGAFTELQGSPSFEWSPLSVRDLALAAECRLELVAS